MRVLDSDWNLGWTDGPTRFLPYWPDSDPLAPLFDVWLGRFPETGYGANVAARYSSIAEHVPVSIEAVPELAAVEGSPLNSTVVDVSYRPDYASTGVVIVDPGDPADLIRFWNLRAGGCDVYPWPVGHEAVFAPAVAVWVKSRLESGQLRRPRNASGEPLRPQVSVWVKNASARDQLNELSTTIEAVGASIEPGLDIDEYPRRSFDAVRTSIEKSFGVDVSSRPNSFSISLPAMPWKDGRRPTRWPGTVAAEVRILGGDTLDPECALVVPRIRRLTALYTRESYGLSPFSWSTGDGFVRGVQANSEGIFVPVFSVQQVAASIIGASGSIDQSDEGRFTTRLTAVMGGRSTNLASQRAAREVLLRTSSSDNGITFKEMMSRAVRNRGDWPWLLVNPKADEQYAQNLLYRLLNCGLIRAVLALSCLQCRSRLILTPESVLSEIVCDFCGEHFSLALALFTAGKSADWRYRIAGHVARSRLEGALPVIATGSILASMAGSWRPALQTFGLRDAQPNWAYEIDVFAIVDSFSPEVVVAEVKCMRAIDAADVEKLERIQSHLRDRNVECFVLIASLREKLHNAEVELLRAHCERRMELLRDNHLPSPVMLPIIFTAAELSAHEHSDNHPVRWAEPGSVAWTIAFESCRRHLGLERIDAVPTGNSMRYEFVWS